jgi:hypothetical protein
MRQKLNENEKKQPISIKVDPIIFEELNKIKNKSKYIENIIYQDMRKNNIITKDILL